MNRNRLIVVAAGAATLLVTIGTVVAVSVSDAVVSTPAGAVIQPTSTSISESTSTSTRTSPPTRTTTSTSTSLPAPTVTPGGAIGRDQAIEIALARTGDGTVTSVEWEVEHGRIEWKVRVRSGGNRFDVRVDAITGTVTRTDVKDDHGDGDGDGGKDGDRGRGHDDRPGDDDSGRG